MVGLTPTDALAGAQGHPHAAPNGTLGKLGHQVALADASPPFQPDELLLTDQGRGQDPLQLRQFVGAPYQGGGKTGDQAW